jgi:hypothetical protein
MEQRAKGNKPEKTYEKVHNPYSALRHALRALLVRSGWDQSQSGEADRPGDTTERSLLEQKE